MAVPEVLLHVGDPLVGAAPFGQVDVDPVLEGVGLDPNPDLFLSADVHPSSGVALGTAGLEASAVRVGHAAGFDNRHGQLFSH